MLICTLQAGFSKFMIIKQGKYDEVYRLPLIAAYGTAAPGYLRRH
jgi:hypothetical protein